MPSRLLAVRGDAASCIVRTMPNEIEDDIPISLQDLADIWNGSQFVGYVDEEMLDDLAERTTSEKPRTVTLYYSDESLLILRLVWSITPQGGRVTATYCTVAEQLDKLQFS